MYVHNRYHGCLFCYRNTSLRYHWSVTDGSISTVKYFGQLLLTSLYDSVFFPFYLQIMFCREPTLLQFAT